MRLPFLIDDGSEVDPQIFAVDSEDNNITPSTEPEAVSTHEAFSKSTIQIEQTWVSCAPTS